MRGGVLPGDDCQEGGQEPRAIGPKATPKRVDRVVIGWGSGSDSVLFARASLWFRYGFAMVCWVSSASLAFYSHCAPRTAHTTAHHIIETLLRLKRLRRFGGASSRAHPGADLKFRAVVGWNAAFMRQG
jgi:hypothetical protein